jgi:hypothetical protein
MITFLAPNFKPIEVTRSDPGPAPNPPRIRANNLNLGPLRENNLSHHRCMSELVFFKDVAGEAGEEGDVGV